MAFLAESSNLMLRTHNTQGTGPWGVSCMKRSTSEPISEKNINKISVYTVSAVFMHVCEFPNSLDFNSLKKDASVYQASVWADIKHSCACVLLTMWTLPAAPPSSDNHCQWRHCLLRHRSLFRWTAPGCGSSSVSSHPSPWSDSRWTDAAFCGPSSGPTWKVDLEKHRSTGFKGAITVQLLLLVMPIR